MTEIKNGDTVVVDLLAPESSWHKAEGVLVEVSRYSNTGGKVRITKLGPNHRGHYIVGNEYRLVNLTKAPGFRVGTKAKYSGNLLGFDGKTVKVTEARMYGVFDYTVVRGDGAEAPVHHFELQRIEEPVAPKPVVFKKGDIVKPKAGSHVYVGFDDKTIIVDGIETGTYPVRVRVLGDKANVRYYSHKELEAGEPLAPWEIELLDASAHYSKVPTLVDYVKADVKATEALYPKVTETPKAEAVDGPAHYGGKDNPYEVIKVAEAWGFNENAYLFNALKYLGRAGKKGDKVEDLKKLVFYAEREIALEQAK